jgi:hypothetical protein
MKSLLVQIIDALRRRLVDEPAAHPHRTTWNRKPTTFGHEEIEA